MEWVVVRNKFGLVILGLTLVGVSGCSRVPDAVNPVSWYRDVTGASKNDDLGKDENEQNLAEGGNEPYPNLGNVPSSPDAQLSGVDRDKLVKSLVADRNNAQYSADNLRAGDVASTVPPPVPPTRNTPDTSSTPAPASSSATIASATPASPPSSSAPPAPAPSAPPSAAPPSAEPPSPAPPSPKTTASAAPPPVAAAPPPPPPATTSPAPPPAPSATASSKPSSSPGSNVPGSNSQQRKPPARGSEAPPAESSLQSPTIPNLPQGESVTPPPPRVPPANQVANTAPPPPSTRGTTLRPPAGAPTQQATAPANAPATAATHRPDVSYRVADVSFAPGSAYLSGALRGTVAEIVKIHNTEGGTIRIVGFGESTGKDAAVAGLTLALDRAQAVAVALTDSGVAAKDISIEAAPVAAKGGADAPRAEVYIEQ
jgi:outer membrane protein OmpA-like peptidoglycan-associated protein